MFLLQTNPEVWWNVFRLAAGLYLACGFFFVIFSSGKTQSWNAFAETGSASGDIIFYLKFKSVI